MLEAAGVQCAYDGRTVLERASLALRPGEFVALAGPNGSGKSTLIRALSRALRPRAGRVSLDGRDLFAGISAREAARSIAVVPQEAPLDFDFSCDEIVMMGRHPHLARFAGESALDRDAVRRAMETTGTSDFSARPVTQLSGGERRRVLLARALAQEPRFLLLDEPVSHMDLHFQVEMLRAVKNSGAAVLAVLHDLNLARGFASRVALLHGGRIVADGTPAEILTEETLLPVFGPVTRTIEGFIVPRIA